jgi:hypothetical protein
MSHELRLSGWPAALSFAVALAGCDVMGYEDDIEGWYRYSGTVEDSWGYAVDGELRIYDQRYDEAYADVEWYMLDGDRVIFEVLAEDVPVWLDPGGRVRFTTYGDLRMSDGRWREFELHHEGRVSGHTMSGWWELDTDVPSYDEGRFTARR